jgi:hypothetical protein
MPRETGVRSPIGTKASEGLVVATPNTRIIVSSMTLMLLLLLAGCFEDAFVGLFLAQHFFREVIAEGVYEARLAGATSWVFG